jgi:FKBP-type peptidyl-prolyl cis-trans isomerase 2
MRQAKHGDTVRVHYRGKLPDGSVFDETFDRGPPRFTIGGGQLLPGFEEAVVGMKPGDSTTAELPAEQAFGPYQEDLVVVLPKSSFADWEVEPEVGECVQIPHPEGPPIDVTVVEITESTVTVDANHPLAGESLFIDIELVDIVYGPH